MPSPFIPAPRRLYIVAALLLAACAARAQDATRIVAATIFPDGAAVERELKVPGGTRHVVLACLPAAVDVATLQVDGDPALRVGDVRATALPASRTEDCAPAPAAARRGAIDVQRSALQAQRESNELALAWLRQFGTRAPASLPAADKTAADAARPAATADSLRHAALDLLTDQARVKRELEAVDRELVKLADEQPSGRGRTGWRTVRFDVWTPAAATLRVRYAVGGTWWRPTYRASVDTAHPGMRLERQADIVQASGEDWSDVRIRLSTGRQAPGAPGALPQPWWIDLLEPVATASSANRLFAAAPALAGRPAPVADAKREREDAVAEPAAEPPPWDVELDQTASATEFALAQPVTLASDGETHTVAIATQTLPVTLKRRSTPRTDAAVALFAEAERPAGVWLAGPLQAFRDGTLVARTDWHPAAEDTLQIALGQDDRMRVDVESPARFTGSAGLLGGRTERSAKAVYTVTNLHAEPVEVELVDAAPVSRNEQVTVRSAWEPAPQTTDWHKLPGVAAWPLKIAGGKSASVAITQVVSYPKDRQVANLP